MYNLYRVYIQHAKITDTKKHLKSLEAIVNFDRTVESHDTRAFLMKTSKHLTPLCEVTLEKLNHHGY